MRRFTKKKPTRNSKEMCSVQHQDIENVPALLESKPSKTKLNSRRTCMKCCTSEAVAVVRMDDPLCRTCFLAYFTHKFRATIGKARAVRAGEKVLLAFSGGQSSSAMLHLVSEGVSSRVPKKLRFEPGVVFIDEGEILNCDKEERLRSVEQITEITSKLGFPYHQLCLEDAFDWEKFTQDGTTCCRNLEKLETGKDNAEKLKCLLEATLSLTAKEDLVKTLRTRVLLDTARKEGYSKVMLGDSATRISIRLLSDISQGRGGDLPYDTGFSDERHGDIIFIRPMREFMIKEIALYNYFNRVETVSITKLGSMTHSHASIDHLTEEFVSSLQLEFPFTVSTIFRTGDKLSGKEFSDDHPICAFCGVPSILGERLHSVDLYDSTRPSSSTSDCCSDCNGRCSSSSGQQLSKEAFIQALCFGCQLTFKDTRLNLSHLPAYVVEVAKKTHHRAQMKEKIKDFLMED